MGKRKIEVVRKHTVEPKREVYVIPQIPEDTVGLRNLKEKFEKTIEKIFSYIYN